MSESVHTILYYILFKHLGLTKNKNIFRNDPSETSENVSRHRLRSNSYFDDVFPLIDTNPENVESVSGFSAKLTGTL